MRQFSYDENKPRKCHMIVNVTRTRRKKDDKFDISSSELPIKHKR